MNKAVFLDRDGTINSDKNYLYKIEDFEFTYKAVEALALLQKYGYKLVIVTNQSGVARGYYTEEDVVLLHEWLKEYLIGKGIHIDGIYYCPHHPEGTVRKYACSCDCRKPAPGLYYKAIHDLDIDTQASFAVGDSLRDLEICKLTDIKGILISRGDSNLNRGENGSMPDYDIASNLYEAALMITGQKSPHSGVVDAQ
jgi:D-glycero-D-manno-heptose 1,7-bisphosphate phosphatase